jgi:hypothetical protein
MRKTVSFSINPEILTEIASTKRSESTSERVNELLKRGLESERRERFEQEAAEFFSNPASGAESGRAAYLEAAIKVISRDE